MDCSSLEKCSKAGRRLSAAGKVWGKAADAEPAACLAASSVCAAGDNQFGDPGLAAAAPGECAGDEGASWGGDMDG